VSTVPRVESPLFRAEGHRYLARMFAAGALTQLEAHDPAYPQLVPFVSTWVTWGGTNPDSDYLYAAVHPDYTYRLRGRRGSVHLFAVETFAGDFNDMMKIQACGMGLDVIGGPSNLSFGPDGEVDIVLSQKEHEGNWVPIPDVPGHVLLRFCYYDWEVGDRPELVIEREGADYPPPPVTAEELECRLGLLLEFIRQGPQTCARAAEMYFAGDPGSVRFPPWSLEETADYDRQLSFRDQLYGQGHYTLDDGEVVLLESTVPVSSYWSFNLSSPYLENSDWHLRQNSINGHQAVVAADGRFRAVIAHEDPGVPNWLDTGRRPIGIIQARFLRPSAMPEVSLRTLPADRVRDALPVDTPVVSPRERQESVRRRILAVQRRGH